MSFLTIVWDVNPEMFPSIFENLWIHPRWYGVLFATAFLLGFKLEENIFKREKLPAEWVDSLFMTVLIGTVLGARFGHVFFYGWEYYSQHPADILKIWEGGLASHGAVIGIVLALVYWSKTVSKKSVIWALDRVVIAVSLGGALVRLGNFFNSEIVGKPSNAPWAVEFVRLGDHVTRHPAQLYESIAYLFTFLVLGHFYWRMEKGEEKGFLLGVFLIMVFGFRFFVEFFKENQEAFEASMTLNMGQLLSIPLVLIGIYFVINSQLKKRANS